MSDVILFYFHYALYLYVWFIVAIRLVREYGAGKLNGPMKYPAYAVVYSFIVADVFYNWLLSLPFWELPKDWKETTSMRLARYAGDITDPYRRGVALILGRMLNIIDPGHIPGA